MRSRVVAVVAATAIASLPVPAFATQGVSVDLGRVEVDEPLRAGQRYQLPTIGVTNPGTESATFEVSVDARAGVDAAPDDWFRLAPSSFELDPGDTQPVAVELVLPPGARPDRYEQLLSAKLVVGESGGTTVGAAAASILTFEVVPSTLVEGLWLSIVSFFRAGQPWTTAAVIAAAVVVLVGWVRRNFEFAVSKRV